MTIVEQFNEALAAYPDTKPLAYFCVRNSGLVLASLRSASAREVETIERCAKVAEMAAKGASDILALMGRQDDQMIFAAQRDIAKVIARDIRALAPPPSPTTLAE